MATGRSCRRAAATAATTSATSAHRTISPGRLSIIALYTLIDGLGVRAAGNAASYVATLFVFEGLPYLALVLWRRRADIDATLAHMAGRWKLALAGTAASFGSYAIALWAMTQAPVALVASLRETSELFATLIGARLLKEKLTPRRWAGVAAVVPEPAVPGCGDG